MEGAHSRHSHGSRVGGRPRPERRVWQSPRAPRSGRREAGPLPGSPRTLFPSGELAVEEVGGGFVGGEPVGVDEEVVDLVGKDELLEGDALRPAGPRPGSTVW